jgi:IS4 transposase
MPVDKSSGLQCDQIVMLTGFYSQKDYPEKLRRIRYYDDQHNRRLVFLTNNFSLPALTITDLYRCRWQVELFFKWIKQHLRIKAFYGTTENAVKTQIWIEARNRFLQYHALRKIKATSDKHLQ